MQRRPFFLADVHPSAGDLASASTPTLPAAARRFSSSLESRTRRGWRIGQ